MSWTSLRRAHHPLQRRCPLDRRRHLAPRKTFSGHQRAAQKSEMSGAQSRNTPSARVVVLSTDPEGDRAALLDQPHLEQLVEVRGDQRLGAIDAATLHVMNRAAAHAQITSA